MRTMTNFLDLKKEKKGERKLRLSTASAESRRGEFLLKTADDMLITFP